jgi:LPS-assembly protein
MQSRRPSGTRPRSRFALTPVALVACALLHPLLARAQTLPGEPALQLKPSAMLREDIPAPAREGLPTYVSGDHLSGRTDLETVIDGNAELRRGDT